MDPGEYNLYLCGCKNRATLNQNATICIILIPSRELQKIRLHNFSTDSTNGGWCQSHFIVNERKSI